MLLGFSANNKTVFLQSRQKEFRASVSGTGEKDGIDCSPQTSVTGWWPSVHWGQCLPWLCAPPPWGSCRRTEGSGHFWGTLTSQRSPRKNSPSLISRIPKQFYNSDSKSFDLKGDPISAFSCLGFIDVIIFLKKQMNNKLYLKDFILKNCLINWGFPRSVTCLRSQWLGNNSNQTVCKRCYLRRVLWIHNKQEYKSRVFSLRRKDDF